MNWNVCNPTSTKTKVGKVRVEPKTFGTSDFKRICCDIDADWVTNLAFYLNHVMRGVSIVITNF